MFQVNCCLICSKRVCLFKMEKENIIISTRSFSFEFLSASSVRFFSSFTKYSTWKVGLLDDLLPVNGEYYFARLPPASDLSYFLENSPLFSMEMSE